jgi:hypothetical protein
MAGVQWPACGGRRTAAGGQWAHAGFGCQSGPVSSPPPDSSRPVHSERMWPGPAAWLLAAGGIAALAIAYASAVGPVAGGLIAVVGGTTAVLMLVRWAVRISVTDQGLQAGRAFLEWPYVGRVIALDGQGARLARGPQGDASAFLVLRPGVGPGAVVVEVTDPQDPHRTWLVSSRDPQRLASAIEGARGRVSS